MAPTETQNDGQLLDSQKLRAVATFDLYPPSTSPGPSSGSDSDSNAELLASTMVKDHPEAQVRRGQQYPGRRRLAVAAAEVSANDLENFLSSNWYSARTFQLLRATVHVPAGFIVILSDDVFVLKRVNELISTKSRSSILKELAALFA